LPSEEQSLHQQQEATRCWNKAQNVELLTVLYL